MALEYCVLASGSSGNCLWVKGGGVEILLDLGLSLRTLRQRLSDIGRDVKDIEAVFCTHFHGDHAGGAAVFSRKIGGQIYATLPTQHGLRGVVPELLRGLPERGAVTLGKGLTVKTMPTPHDAPGSVSLVVTDGETSVGLVTDLGRATDGLVHHLSGLDGLVLEMNHDPKMVEDGPYPHHLKRRVLGDWGHLSNAQGAALLRKVAHRGLQHVTLAHLSGTNNTPELAKRAAEEVLAKVRLRPRLRIGKQWKVGEPVLLRAPRQLSLRFA